MIEYKLLKSPITGNVFPQQVNSQSFTKKDLIDRLSKHFGSISSGVIEEALYILREEIGKGSTVSLDDFGTFSLRLGINKEDVKEYEEVRSQDIIIKGVRFNAAKKLRNATGKKKVHLQDGDKVRREVTANDRWHTLHDYILMEHDENKRPVNEITISVSTYRRLTGCTDYTARKELAGFCKEGRLRELHASHNKLYVVNGKE